MDIRSLNGKKVCILGMGREGTSMQTALEKYAPKAQVTTRDQKDGEGYLSGLDAFDVIIKSPGIPPQKIPEAVVNKITSSTQIFLSTVAKYGSLVIGVTGTKGKSTTASLIYAILKESGENVFLVGNIGEPAIAYLHVAKKDTIFVYEISSFQLEDLRQIPVPQHCSPPIAVITSFFAEHLDHHGSEKEYKLAKANIVAFQKPNDVVFFNDLGGGEAIAAYSHGEKINVKSEALPILLEATKMKGMHNHANMQLACAVARYLKVSEEHIVNALQKFQPLAHRMQSLGMHDGIEWIDDAISTIPESTLAAMITFEGKIGTLIVGGQDRGLDFTALGKDIANSAILNIIAFPDSGDRIVEAMKDAGGKQNIDAVTSMEDAVKIALEKTPQGMICLLSPASPSYNMYKNFEEKGDAFARCIRSGKMV